MAKSETPNTGQPDPDKPLNFQGWNRSGDPNSVDAKEQLDELRELTAVATAAQEAVDAKVARIHGGLGWQKPSAREIGEAAGISHTQVARIAKRLREQE